MKYRTKYNIAVLSFLILFFAVSILRATPPTSGVLFLYSGFEVGSVEEWSRVVEGDAVIEIDSGFPLVFEVRTGSVLGTGYDHDGEWSIWREVHEISLDQSSDAIAIIKCQSGPAYTPCEGAERGDIATITGVFVDGFQTGLDLLVIEFEPFRASSLFSKIREWPFANCPEPGDTRNNVCLWAGDFEVEVHVIGLGVRPTGEQRTRKSAEFYFIDPENIELMIKVLDGCSHNGHYWVFAAGLTDQEVDISVRHLDREQPLERSWRTKPGVPMTAITDTAAFPC